MMVGMARDAEKFLFTFLVATWTIGSSVTTCPDVCKSDNNKTSCLPSSFNITLKENEVTHDLRVCCDEDLANILLYKFAKIYTEVSVHYENLCNSSVVVFDFPTLSALAITLANNSISKVIMNVQFLKVRQIDLSYNRLRSLNKAQFGDFVNLRQLILRKNEIHSIAEDSFVGLTKLETLDLSDNRLTILTNVFLPLSNLQHLNISRNELQNLSDNYFNNWVLQHLDISHNELRTVAPAALQHLPNLARLLIADNPHLGIARLDTQLLVGTGRRLQQIDASRTGLSKVPEAFTHSVRFLSLVGNNITAIRCGDLDSYPLLQSLDFSENKISSIEDDSLGRLEMLLFLNVNKNYLGAVPKSLPDELKYLSFNDNLIKNLSILDFKNLPNLKILLIKNNLISYIEDHVFDDLLSLEMLDLSNNPIRTLSSNTFDGPLSLRDLRLCFLNVSMPGADGSFPMSSPESVQMLHLKSSPGLARLLLADSAALAAFSRLQYLDLRMNNISEVRNDLLFYLVQLKTLRLHGNRLNCTNETWLTDWMNWNRNSSNDETCYYSTPEAKLEMSKYNCTFPETFTISESLPPVNLYSTEMINKLLRYYGYLYNKTEKSPPKRSNDIQTAATNQNKNSYENFTSSGEQVKDRRKINIGNDSNEINFSNKPSFGGTQLRKKSASFYESINKRPLDSRKSSATRVENNNNIKTGVDSYVPFVRAKLNIDGVDRVTQPKSTDAPILVPEKKSNFEENQNAPTENAYTNNNLLEYSPYQSIRSKYAEYTITIGVVSLLVTAVGLWVGFRLHFKRRRAQEINSSIEDQIEVSNISGGVLW
ncbi:leucine-rich repeat-containing protein 40 [Aricia agestis]|uniref:leucine-rich repeat-containing protein 40 n=1 Tax=Aricia agestis TaxID=91739 RepID=UPI001C2016C9|nr:leucine-rich repeat-containing protein 40 [Aricia agestis]